MKIPAIRFLPHPFPRHADVQPRRDSQVDGMRFLCTSGDMLVKNFPARLKTGDSWYLTGLGHTQ